MTELYPIKYCLDRLYEKAENDKAKTRKFSIKKPKILSQNRKTSILNFAELCQDLNRDINVVKAFIDDRLKTPSSICGKNEEILLIDNVFKVDQILNEIIKYAETFVICQECRSGNTVLVKDNRLLYLKCNACNSRKTV